MNSSELIVILIVAIIVFGPSKLPMLAIHLGKLFREVNRLKEHFSTFWQTQLNEQQLRENEKKAEKADATYNEFK